MLFVVAVVLAVVSFELVPSGSSPPTPGSLAFVVQPEGATQIDGVFLTETRSSGRYQVTLSTTIPAKSNEDIYVDGYYPPGDRLVTCSPAKCTRLSRTYVLNMSFKMPSATRAQTTGTYAYPEEHLTFRGAPIGFASNSLEAAVALPQIEVTLSLLKQQETVGAVSVSYTLTNASSYNWNSGLHPVSVEGRLVTWYLPLQSLRTSLSSATSATSGGSGSFSSESAQVGAVDDATQARNDRFTFLGGALLGVAGGALVSAVQEALDAREKEDEEKEPQPA